MKGDQPERLVPLHAFVVRDRGLGTAYRSHASSHGLTLPVEIRRESAEIQLDDFRVVREFAPGAFVRVAPLVEYVRPVSNLKAPSSVLLDHNNGHPGFVDLSGTNERLVLTHR